MLLPLSATWERLFCHQPIVKEMLFPIKPKLTKIPDAEFTVQAYNSGNFTGRQWGARELRLKSNEDLHKLWYVLLKEKLALKADFFYATKTNSRFFGKNDIKKIRFTMARVLTIINERKALINEFRSLLEDQYIYEAKKLEPKKKIEEKESKTLKKLNKKKPKDILVGNPKELASQSVLSVEDIELIKDSQNFVTQKMMLKKYVRNWRSLKQKQKKIALGQIHAIR